MTRDDLWHRNFSLLKTYVAEHHHLPDKKKVENRGLLSWAKYQRKRIRAEALNEEKTRLFMELMSTRSDEHTGGRKRKSDPPEVLQLELDFD